MGRIIHNFTSNSIVQLLASIVNTYYAGAACPVPSDEGVKRTATPNLSF